MINIKKRVLLAFTILITVILILIIYARYIEPSLLIVKRENMQSEKISSQIRVVFFTDTHFSKDYSQKNATRIAEKINSLKPNIVIFGGDFLNSYYADHSIIDLDYIKNAFSKINASYGKYAVFGNHEYGGGFSDKYSDFMSGAGFVTLKDTAMYIKKLNINIIGVDDFLQGKLNTDIDTLKRSDSYNILITHSPDYVDHTDIAGIDLVLAGHTHGKQILFDKFKYAKGFYSIGITKLFVSAGIGLSGPPFRFLNPPEIVLLNISR